MVAPLVLLGSLAAIASATPLTMDFSPYLTPMELFKRVNSGCGTSGATSCSSSASGTCCFESPGGLLLQTQFWDTNPSTGPSNSWTIHGLWPDNCDGTFESSCDPTRAYTGIDSLLTAQGASDTLSFMETYWVDINGQNEQFWEHEWSKHGTCYSTLETSCLPSGSPRGAEAVAFFQQVVALFKTLPTYDWLAQAGITPDASRTLTLSQVTSALKSASGVTPALDCSGTNLNQISWYFNLKGSLFDGQFVPIDAPSAGSCASTGLKYPPKTGSTTTITTSTTTGTTTATSSSSTPTGGSGSLPSKATLHASITGGLLSAGTWSIQTLATYTLSGSTSSFTMTTSKGSCGVVSGQLECGSGISATSFSAVSSGSTLLLASGGSTTWSSTGTPSGTIQEAVFTGSAKGTSYTISIVSS